MFALKKLSPEAIPAALERAVHYRLLNEPGEAVSICHDILSASPDHQQALVTLLLALTDRFGKSFDLGATHPADILPRLQDPYERVYYAGIIHERRAKALLQKGTPGHVAYGFLRDAMDCFEKASTQRPPGNDDALLHWNACARIIMHNSLEPRDEERVVMQSE